jgi:hypothetical protein
MCDIIALAFQTDKTRIASLLLARDLSSLYYPFLNVSVGHHNASHNDTSNGYERITRFQLSQLAYLAQKLEAMPEGNGTVLRPALRSHEFRNPGGRSSPSHVRFPQGSC